MSLKKSTVFLLILALAACERDQAKVGLEGSKLLKPVTQEKLNVFARKLDVSYKVITNRPGEGSCDPEREEGRCFVARIQLTSPVPFHYSGWAIYFSEIRPIQADESPQFDIEHINGDLHRIIPTDKFSGFKPGESKAIWFTADSWHLSETDLMPNYYIAAEGLEARVIESTRPLLNSKTGLEELPYIESFSGSEHQFKYDEGDRTHRATAGMLYSVNMEIQDKPEVSEAGIIPTPRELIADPERGEVNLSGGIKVETAGVERGEIVTALNRLEKLGIQESGGESAQIVNIQVRPDYAFAKEGYELQVKASGIEIKASDAAGAAYALQSLGGLVKVGEPVIPRVTIKDSPRYGFRGMHLDVARNFHSKSLVIDLLDQMHAYKLNKFHLHLADDEGWRLEIKGLPELTDVGATRCHDLEESECLMPQLGSGPNPDSPVNGYFSDNDYIEILKAAQARHIEVIPSLDMPGHARAAIKSMEVRYRKFMDKGKEDKAREFLLTDFKDQSQYSSIQNYNDNTINVCMESSYRFINKIITEMQRIHEKAGVPLRRYHIGADETAGAWLDSPECKKFIKNNKVGVEDPKELGGYFIERISAMLTDRDIVPAAWSDGLMETREAYMPDKVQANVWGALFWDGHKVAHTFANRGWDVVVSTPDVLYFDFPQQADPRERGYYWASRHTTLRKVFQFMPDNLPVHAELWKDRQDKPFTVNDDMPLDENADYLGMQGHLWSETVRSDAQVEYMIFPRLLALAERAWHNADWEVAYDHSGGEYGPESHSFTETSRERRQSDWLRFVNVLGYKELKKLDMFDIDYRIPTVGAVIENGHLKAKVLFPNMPIQYKVGQNPWKEYKGEVAVPVDAPVKVRALSVDGTRKGRMLTVN